MVALIDFEVARSVSVKDKLLTLRNRPLHQWTLKTIKKRPKPSKKGQNHQKNTKPSKKGQKTIKKVHKTIKKSPHQKFWGGLFFMVQILWTFFDGFLAFFWWFGIFFMVLAFFWWFWLFFDGFQSSLVKRPNGLKSYFHISDLHINKNLII